MLPFPLQKVVIAAAGLVRILVADAGPRLVDRAAARVLVDEHADRAVDLVLLMAQHLLAFLHFREAAARGLDVDGEMPGQPGQILVLDDDPLVAAAVRRTLQAVVGVLARRNESIDGDRKS